MMQIRTKNPALKRLLQRNISEDEIIFNDSGVATVSKEVGKQLVKLIPDLETVKPSKAKAKERNDAT